MEPVARHSKRLLSGSARYDTASEGNNQERHTPMSNTSQPLEEWGDNFIPVIPVDHATHTLDNPFCDDPSCLCHEDEDNIEMVNQAYEDGIITAHDATDIVKGVKSW